jgi:aminopeptidase YwaD
MPVSSLTMSGHHNSSLKPNRRPQRFPARALWDDWQNLCTTIGERRAGTAAERRAVDFVAHRFAAAGLAPIHIEPFPCVSLQRATVQVHARHGGAWQRVDAATLVGAPGTPSGRAVTGDLVWLELPENSHRIRPADIRGRIVAVFGPLPSSAETHRRLVEAGPLAVIHVDDRLPFAWTKNDGVYPYWVRRYGMPPMLTVPYTEAWRWRRDGVRQVRIRSAIVQPDAASHNVVAEWPGTAPGLPAVVLTAHHDTQCGNEGADDNASGVVCLLALARALHGLPLLRTVRFISFGAEEQLSAGSFAYVRQHAASQDRPGIVINFDSVSSPLGHWQMSVAGSAGLQRIAVRELAACGLDVEARSEITPYSDHFPFNRAGIPSLWFMRPNFPGGRWQHHSVHDTLQNVSVEPVRALLAAVQPLIQTLASQARWPFRAVLPAPQLALARRIGRELYG